MSFIKMTSVTSVIFQPIVDTISNDRDAIHENWLYTKDFVNYNELCEICILKDQGFGKI